MRPKLNIVIPAFEYAFGVKRMLKILSENSNAEFEIIISDDSNSNDVWETVSWFIKETDLSIRYVKTFVKTGAVDNWNYLLDISSAEYVWLMHHDDFILNDDSFSLLLESLSHDNSSDVFISNCLTFDVITKSTRPEVPRFIKKAILQSYPEYLFKRNFIGPPSCLIFKRNINFKYDSNLLLLVDVDFFYRVIKAFPNITFLDITVVSSENLKGQITSLIKNSRKDLEKTELRYLVDSKKILLLNFFLRKNLTSILFRAFEICLWSNIKFITKAKSLFKMKNDYNFYD